MPQRGEFGRWAGKTDRLQMGQDADEKFFAGQVPDSSIHIAALVARIILLYAPPTLASRSVSAATGAENPILIRIQLFLASVGHLVNDLCAMNAHPNPWRRLHSIVVYAYYPCNTLNQRYVVGGSLAFGHFSGKRMDVVLIPTSRRTG